VIKLRDAIKQVSLTHVLLFAVAVSLLLTWQEMRTINKTLLLIHKDTLGIDVDLTTPIDVNVTH
jgi:hypothetical protein